MKLEIILARRGDDHFAAGLVSFLLIFILSGCLSRNELTSLEAKSEIGRFEQSYLNMARLENAFPINEAAREDGFLVGVNYWRNHGKEVEAFSLEKDRFKEHLRRRSGSSIEDYNLKLLRLQKKHGVAYHSLFPVDGGLTGMEAVSAAKQYVRTHQLSPTKYLSWAYPEK